MNVLGVIFDSKLSWANYMHAQNIIDVTMAIIKSKLLCDVPISQSRQNVKFILKEVNPFNTIFKGA